ncbi:toll/interleukin-1 receptor domain-containing protein [Sorangium sp. So ce291]|uniref:toll/interleukin-1 receptor domain-containing protein n=1 Tax=Sorangium sp. So ce291 TaxID=3133294 RepID=UPI003F5E5381
MAYVRIRAAMARVFLSHANVDKPMVRRVAEALRSAGHDPWIDDEQILVGESIPAAIERGLRQADFIVVCLSKSAAERGWVEAERDATLMQQLRERRARILPLRLEDVTPPYLIAPFAYVDVFPDSDAFRHGIERLVRSIDAHNHEHPTTGSIAVDPHVEQELIRSLVEKHSLTQGARRILEQKPFAWEGLFFSRVLMDELERISDLRRDLKYGVSRGPVIRLGDLEVLGWISGQLAEIRHVAGSIVAVTNSGLEEAMGPPGVPGDPEKIAYVARRIVDGCREAIDWTFRMRRLSVDEEFDKLVSIMQRWGVKIVQDVEAWSVSLNCKLKEFVASPPAPGERVVFAFQGAIDAPDREGFDDELARLTDVMVRRGRQNGW